MEMKKIEDISSHARDLGCERVQIDGKEYRVLEKISDTKYLVMSVDFIGARIF